MAECQICSSKTALLTAQEEDEYNILKEHSTMEKATGHLQARYPFKKDPGVLIDNGKDAKAFQITLKCRQIKNKTHSQYTDQFQDMFNRGVVSEIS